MQLKEERNNMKKHKNRFAFFYDLNKYSLKELIVNYFVMFGWILCLIIEIINCLVHKNYLIAISQGKITVRPWLFDRLTRFAFVFLALTIIGGIVKIIWTRKRKQGKLPSYYETLQSNFHNASLEKTSSVLKVIYIVIALAITTLVMLAVWYF